MGGWASPGLKGSIGKETCLHVRDNDQERMLTSF